MSGDTYRVIITREDGHWLADVPSLQGVLHRIVPDTDLDLTVWVSRCWRGTITNMQPEEHDAIGWFRLGQLAGLRFADPSYLGLLQGLLSE